MIVAASCVESARLVLNSKSRHWPAGIANSSGQAGRNLCDHLYGTTASGYLPQLLGQPAFPDNVSASQVVWMPRWQNLKGAHEEKFVRGYSIYPTGGCGEFPWYFRELEGFGSEWKRDIKRYYRAPVSFYCQIPSLPSATNFVDIDPDVKDAFGIPAVRVHFQWGSNDLMMWDHARQVSAERDRGVRREGVAGGHLSEHARLQPARNRHAPHGQRSEEIRHQQVRPDARRAEPVRG